MEIEGVDKFRKIVLVASMLFSVFTLLILINDPTGCPGSNLQLGLWVTFSIQISTFFLLLLHFIGLGGCLEKLGRLLGLYYFFLVGAMVFV